jgi:hypothetical protein
MRGNPQAAYGRLLTVLPGGRQAALRERTAPKQRRDRGEELEVIERLDAQERRERRKGEYAPNLRLLR